jgi:hypothetical protein
VHELVKNHSISIKFQSSSSTVPCLSQQKKLSALSFYKRSTSGQDFLYDVITVPIESIMYAMVTWCSMDPINKKTLYVSINKKQHQPDPSWLKFTSSVAAASPSNFFPELPWLPTGFWPWATGRRWAMKLEIEVEGLEL